jgi:hypothetical protein
MRFQPDLYKELAILGCVETRTGLVGVEGVVTHDQGIGIFFLEPCQQVQQGDFLSACAGVGWLAMAIQTSFQTDANRVLVMTLTVGTNLLDGASFFHASIQLDVEMVANVFVATVFHVVFTASLRRVAAVFARGTAVQYYQGDFSHTIENFKSSFKILFTWCFLFFSFALMHSFSFALMHSFSFALMQKKQKIKG